MAYPNPIHYSVSGGQVSPYSALNGAVQGQSQSTIFPTPGLPPNMSYATRKYHRERVPQRRFQPTSEWRSSFPRHVLMQRPIEFNVAGSNQPGILMADLFRRINSPGTGLLLGANDAVLAPTGFRQIRLRILWPGYQHVEWVRSIDLYTQHGPITRTQLAQAIATQFSRFIEACYPEPVSPRHEEWRLGGSKITLDKLVLVSVFNVFEDSWQADVMIERS